MAHARLIRWLVLVVLTAGCGAAPTAPVAPAPVATAAGSWKGVLAITSCSNGGSGSCVIAPEAFVLRLQSDGRGVLQVDTGLWDSAPAMSVDVTVTPGEPLVVASATPGGLLDARLVLTSAGETLAGQIRYSVNRSTVLQKEGHVLFAERDRTAYGGRFQGEWQGFVSRTSCAGDCAVDDDVLIGGGAVRLALAQSAGRITGVLNGHPLEGTADGDRVTLSTRVVLAPNRCTAGWDSGTLCLIEIAVSGQADGLDRLTGTVTYRIEGVDYRNRPYAYAATANLAGVARWR